MSSYYSIWLEKYKTKCKRILKDLSEYKKEVADIKKKIFENDLILPINVINEELNEKLCFVDGGEGIEELFGGVIYFIRASGLIFSEENEKFVRDLDIGILNYDDYTKERVELLRAIMELDVAEKCIQEHSPEFLFLDGSLYVNSSKREIPCEEFQIYRKKFFRLLKLSKAEEVHLCGISEDSRSRLLLNHLSLKHKVKFPKFMTDSSVLRMLAKNKEFVTKEFFPEQKFEFNSESLEENREKNSNTIKFPTLYIQPTSLSNPLRVDVPNWEKRIDKIISLIVKLSKGSKKFGYPYPLYLVHLDAKIEKKHSNWSTMQIIHHIFKNDPELYDAILREKRRGMRPK